MEAESCPSLSGITGVIAGSNLGCAGMLPFIIWHWILLIERNAFVKRDLPLSFKKIISFMTLNLEQCHLTPDTQHNTYQPLDPIMFTWCCTFHHLPDTCHLTPDTWHHLVWPGDGPEPRRPGVGDEELPSGDGWGAGQVGNPGPGSNNVSNQSPRWRCL